MPLDLLISGSPDDPDLLIILLILILMILICGLNLDLRSKLLTCLNGDIREAFSRRNRRDDGSGEGLFGRHLLQPSLSP